MDFRPGGKVYEIELLNANERLGHLVASKLAVEKKATGATEEIGMP